jgi:hypothetical protein
MATWGKRSETFSRVIMEVSPAMKSIYLKYGDMLSFDVFYDLLTGDLISDACAYKAGVFSVNDTNMRVLIVGVAVFVDETPAILFEVLKDFFKLHDNTKITKSLLTAGQPVITSAVESLR